MPEKRRMEADKKNGPSKDGLSDNEALFYSEPNHGFAWSDAAERALTLGLNASAAQRLQWLEEMIAVAYRCGALPRRRMPDGSIRQ